MTFSRREILRVAGALATAPLASRIVFAQTQQRLRMPPLIDTRTTGKLALRAQPGELSIMGGPPALTAGFNQNYLGPTIVMQNGPLAVRVENALQEPVSSHWHGLLVPGEQDGGPHKAIAPGEAWTGDMQLSQRPCTPWYHSHAHGSTARHVYAGLAGMINYTDGRDDQRGLPSRYGIDDLSLVIQDRRFDDSGRMVYNPDSTDIQNGFQGGRILVNGQFNSIAPVPRGLVRLRLLNGSNARFYTLHFNDRRPFFLIGTDGGFLPKPLEMTYMRMAPAERMEILVDFAEGPAPMLMSASGLPMKILEFAIDENEKPRIARMPDSIDAEPAWPDVDSLPLRRFALNMGGSSLAEVKQGASVHAAHADHGAPARLIGSGPDGQLGIGMTDFGINGRSYDMRRIDFGVKLGAFERWTISGGGAGVLHPFHVHGVHYRVISTAGASPKPEDSGWKDTVVVDGQAEIIVKFEREAAADAPYMYHCHILEHEDSGMMGLFTVA